MIAKIAMTNGATSTNYQTHSDGFSTFCKSKSIGNGNIMRQKMSIFDKVSSLETGSSTQGE